MSADAVAQQMGRSNVEEMNALNEGRVSDSTGIWYAHTYEANYPQKFKEEWRSGMAPSSHFAKEGSYKFALLPGKSAAAGVEAFFRGLTICECLSAIVAIEYKTILKTVGAKKFDDAFGATDKPVQSRMLIEGRISSNNPLRTYLQQTDAARTGNAGTENERPAKEGEWYYVYNHPKYLLKHPGGAYQGENCFYMGRGPDKKQRWRGFGVDNVTEDEMLRVMAGDYNRRRDDNDKRRMRQYEQQGEDMSVLNIDGVKLKDRVTVAEILNEPEYTSPIDNVSRKGGFVARAGRTLDAQAVADLANG